MEITKELLEKYMKETKLDQKGDVEITDVSIGAYKLKTPGMVQNKTVRLSKVRQWADGISG